MTYRSQLVASLAAAGLIATSSAAFAEAKVALMGGITGPIAGMAPAMIASMKLALDQANAAGLAIGKITYQEFDCGCNPQVATDAATKAVNVFGADAAVGPACSGALLAAVNSVTIPAGVLVVSPSATSPKITDLDDKDLVFRTVPSDDFQGRALARTLLERGVKKVAVAYINNDYGKGLAEAFKAEFEAKGGTITQFRGHEDKKASYRSDLAELAKGGADTLVLFDYGNASGMTILRQAIENGFFKQFVGADGMRDENLIKTLGEANLKHFFVSAPVGEAGAAFEKFAEAARKAGLDPNATFAATSYDAAALVALALEAAKGDKAKLPQALRAVATAPGERIYPGEWEKAKQLLAEGKEIDYKGASGDHEFDAKGDVPGSYAFFKVEGGTYKEVQKMK
ncbi:ABC transporter substrate-binding protein [Hydrogenophilus thiooxidans]|uniref:ABC transporter substrate-binding protein n=1 Tax=Hydrogenophilus thiooxidans TaxID=2820326 RepID=UPI001C2303E4|nr:ABC transporter substrate-binding protein [Hydrogenophilus thiooxidans]